MALLGKKPILPAAERTALAQRLERRSVRILAVATTPDGYAVALPDAFVVRSSAGWEAPLPWHELLRAGWSDDGRLVRWVTLERPQDEQSLPVLEPGDLPGVMAERIDQSIVARQTVELAPGRHASLIGRRPATGDHPIEWMIVPLGSTDLGRPEVRAAAEKLLDGVRAEWA